MISAVRALYAVAPEVPGAYVMTDSWRAWALRLIDEFPECGSQLVFKIAADVVSLGQRDDDPGDSESRVAEELADLGDVVLQLAEAEDAEDAGVERDDEFFDRRQDVRRQQGPRRGGVDENVIVAIGDAFQGRAQAAFAANLPRQDDGRIGQSVIGRKDVHALEVGSNDRFVCAVAFDEDVEQRRPTRLLPLQEDERRITLGIGVHDEDATPLPSQDGRHVQDGRRFGNASLLADERYGPHAQDPPWPCTSVMGPRVLSPLGSRNRDPRGLWGHGAMTSEPSGVRMLWDRGPLGS